MNSNQKENDWHCCCKQHWLLPETLFWKLLQIQMQAIFLHTNWGWFCDIWCIPTSHSCYRATKQNLNLKYCTEILDPSYLSHVIVRAQRWDHRIPHPGILLKQSFKICSPRGSEALTGACLLVCQFIIPHILFTFSSISVLPFKVGMRCVSSTSLPLASTVLPDSSKMSGVGFVTSRASTLL